jgi:hypothetical protein
VYCCLVLVAVHILKDDVSIFALSNRVLLPQPFQGDGGEGNGFLRGYRPLWAFWNGQDWSLLMDYSVGKVLFSQFWFCQKWAGVCEGATTERCTRKGDNRPPIPLRAATFAKQWP